MHLTFDWSTNLRRIRPPGAATTDADDAQRGRWKRFPYGDRVYRYCGAALSGNWSRLHRGDREVYPDAGNLAGLLRANPALAAHVPDPAAAAVGLQAAWRAYHAGDFADAVDRGLATGPAGIVVAARAALVHASRLEDDPLRRAEILRETVASSAALLELAPNWANAWFVHGLALVGHCRQVPLVTTLARGLGSRLRESLRRTLQLEPQHADAHAALGIHCADVIDKAGAMVGALTHGARREAVVAHFEAARALHPQSPVLLADYARALQRAGGGAGAVQALWVDASACQPADALERLDVEGARSELG